MAQNPGLEANRQLACRFFDAMTQRDIKAMEELLHPDFIWNTAVSDDDGPNELSPLQSNLLKGTNLPHPRPRLNREESLQVFGGLMGKSSGGNLKRLVDGNAGEKLVEQGHMAFKILSTTAEDDRVALEARSTGIANPANGRTYGNFYHFLFRIRDGQIVLCKEYQDTLRVYDYVAP
jgi:ketosteroid isomerase-like protein